MLPSVDLRFHAQPKYNRLGPYTFTWWEKIVVVLLWRSSLTLLRGHVGFNLSLWQMRKKRSQKDVSVNHASVKMVYLCGWTRIYLLYFPGTYLYYRPLFFIDFFSLYFNCILQYSVFSSILTIGATISGAISRRTADLIDLRGISFMTLQMLVGLIQSFQLQKHYKPFISSWLRLLLL